MKRTILFIIISILCLMGHSQQDFTIHSLRSIPQSNYSNPAMMPTPKLHIGMPFLSSDYYSFSHTGFNAHHLFKRAPGDSLDIDIGGTIEKMAKYNHIVFNTSIEWLSFGIKLKDIEGKYKHYINFSLSDKVFVNFTYPRSLIEFLYKGNSDEAFLGEVVRFHRLGLNAMHYREYSLGYAIQYTHQWTFGAHAKVLQGLANVYTKKSHVTILTNESNFFITATGDVDIRASLPESVWGDDENNNNDFDFGDYITNTSNMGFAIDLGATYQFNKKLLLGASILDLGFISWKSGTRQFVSSNPGKPFTFEGIDVVEIINEEDSIADKIIQNLVDSVIDILGIDTFKNKYNSPVNTQLHFHASYDLTSKDKVSGLIRFNGFNNTVRTGLSFAYTRNFGNVLNLSVSYTMTARKYFNLGLGFSVNAGTTQFYLTTDNIISPFVHNSYVLNDDNDKQEGFNMIRNTKYLNARFGINFVFGYKEPIDVTPLF